MKDKFDQVLREALSEEGKELWDDLLEVSPLQLVTDNFRSRNRWLNILGMAVGVVFMVLGVLTLIQFVEAEETLAAIRWGLAFIMCMWGLWAVKLWSWAPRPIAADGAHHRAKCSCQRAREGGKSLRRARPGAHPSP